MDSRVHGAEHTNDRKHRQSQRDFDGAVARELTKRVRLPRASQEESKSWRQPKTD